MKLESLEQLLAEELADLQDAEKQLIKALPKMAKAATSPKLQRAFEEHFEQTRAHADRLEQVIKYLDKRPPSKACQGMKGLIKEGDEIAKASGDAAVKDAALIAAAQRVEHYEIAGYDCARTFAELLGYDHAVELLQETLNEEAAADKKLTRVAKGVVNLEAATA
jgi:ferritin-like metal-binding protein YciE